MNMHNQEAAGKGRHAGGALRAAQLGHNEPPSATGLADGAETGGIGSGLLRPRLRGRARRADVFVGRLRTGSPRCRFSGPTPRRRPARRPPCRWPAACCRFFGSRLSPARTERGAKRLPGVVKVRSRAALLCSHSDLRVLRGVTGHHQTTSPGLRARGCEAEAMRTPPLLAEPPPPHSPHSKSLAAVRAMALGSLRVPVVLPDLLKRTVRFTFRYLVTP